MTPPHTVLGVELMDEDHARLEALLEHAAQAADADLPGLFAQAEAETRAHFEREEKLMQSAGLPVFHCHAAQHRLLLAEFDRARISAISGDTASLRHFLIYALPEMLTAHIDSVDRVTASFLRNEIKEEELRPLRLPFE